MPEGSARSGGLSSWGSEDVMTEDWGKFTEENVVERARVGAGYLRKQAQVFVDMPISCASLNLDSPHGALTQAIERVQQTRAFVLSSFSTLPILIHPDPVNNFSTRYVFRLESINKD